jgi:hypothetical protein
MIVGSSPPWASGSLRAGGPSRRRRVGHGDQLPRLAAPGSQAFAFAGSPVPFTHATANPVYFMYYNLGRLRSSDSAGDACHETGVANHAWTVEQIVGFFR